MNDRVDIACACGLRCRAKLRSSAGASMIIALVLFLVCAMVAILVVQGASMNAERLNKQAAEEQGYLELKSAATLVRDMFQPGAAIGKDNLMVSIDAATSTAKLTSSVGTGTGNTRINASRAAGIAAWITSATSAVHSGAQPGTYDTTVQASSSTGVALDQVNVTFSMQDDYTIVARLSSATGTYSTETSLVFHATTSLSPDVDTITWNGAVEIVKGVVE